MLAILLAVLFFATIALVAVKAPGRTTVGRLSGPTLDAGGPQSRAHRQDQATSAKRTRLAPAAPRLYRGVSAEHWAARYRHRTRQLQNARRVLFAQPSVVEAINLACVVYGNCSTLWRKASCETGGTYSPRALNASSGASGLFQFLGSTWRTTPYARFSVWSPYANALAAGWMHAAGRGGEWSCR